ncbi:MAG: diaminopimelate decarboxylase, partial [Bacteroidota bacterium]
MSHNLNKSLIRELANKYHTPLYIFSEKEIRNQCQKLKSAISYENKQIRYACKALTLQAILKIVRSEGIYIDAVSINEVKRAQRAGYNADEILYTGEGASQLAFEELLGKGILINCSSIDQIRLIGKIKKGSSCSIRINPGEGHGAT